MGSSAYKICFHCAPVLIGLKAANTVTLAKDELLCLAKMLQGTTLRYIPLAYTKEKAVAFVYRPKRLETCLQEPFRNHLLQELGYPDGPLESKLYYLRQRFYASQKKKIVFPHELGVFLEYPQCDVLGFIKYKGKNYIFSGYWKVYGQAEQAAEQFALFDNARKRVLQLLHYGVEIRDLFINRQ